MSETASTDKKGFGGPAFHKNPNCKCNACTSRRRKEEAVAVANRARGLPVDADPSKKGKVINADAPLATYGRTAKDRIAQWIAIRHEEPGIKNAEVARRLGISAQYLNSLIVKANKEGWLRFDDPLARIEFELVPKALDNISEFLDQKDKQVTIETFKSTVAAQYKEAKGVSEGPKTIIALKIEVPPNDSGGEQKVLTSNIVGRPKEIIEVTAELVDALPVRETA